MTLKDPSKISEPLFRGEFAFRQAGKGLRFTLDSVLLAAFPVLEKDFTVLDCGCGSGILLLLLAGRERTLRLTGIDINPDLIAFARENCQSNGIEAKLVCGDAMSAATIFPAAAYDLLITNPPYYPVGSCRLPRDSAVAAAKTELFWQQETMLEQAMVLLKPEGTLAVSFDYLRRKEYLRLAEKVGFYPARMLSLQTAKNRPPKRFLLELKKVPAVLREETLLLYDESGAETPAMKRILKVYDRTGIVPCGDAHR